jgi:hypothetical protein
VIQDVEDFRPELCVKVSEILLKELFLTNEKSRFVRPGPYTTSRPELPARLKHCGGAPMAFPVTLQQIDGAS